MEDSKLFFPRCPVCGSAAFARFEAKFDYIQLCDYIYHCDNCKTKWIDRFELRYLETQIATDKKDTI